MVRGAFFLAIIILGGAIMTFFGKNTEIQDEKVRDPGAAGSFYPGDSTTLSQMVIQLLDQAKPPVIKGNIIGLVSPHAGYVYSGHVAAYGYELLKKRGIERVVVISPSHILGFHGSAVYDGTAYRTPLGIIPVDNDFCNQLVAQDPSIYRSSDGHETRSRQWNADRLHR